MTARRKFSSGLQYFDEEESDNKVVCRMCTRKLAYNRSTRAMRNHIYQRYLDINLQGERATTSNTWQTSITTFATPSHRRCDADQSEKIMQLITEMTNRDLLPLCFTVKAKAFLS